MDTARKQTDRKLQWIETRIKRFYKEAGKDLTKKWQDYMKRGEKRLERIKESGDEEAYTKALENYTLKNLWYRDMVDATTEQLAHVNETALEFIKDQLPEVYATNYNQMAEVYEKVQVTSGVNMGIRFDLRDANTIKRMILDGDIEMPNQEKRLSIPKDKRWNTKQINSSILRGILQGESLRDMAKRIQPITDNNYKSAIRNARTLVTGAESRGRLDSYKQAEDDGMVLNKVWMSTPDGHTRDWHIELDGQEVPVEDSFVDGLGNLLEYPGDPGGAPETVYNCRCTMTTHVIGFRQADGSIVYIDYNGDRTLHEDQMDAERDRRGMQPIVVDSFQSRLGAAKSVVEINKLLNDQRWFRKVSDWGDGIYSQADLTGCDLDSAKSIAASYEQVFTKFPQLKGRFDAPDAQPINMKDGTYAWCYTRHNGKVQVNPNKYNNWASLSKKYEQDVVSNWHPEGTTAESIITHEIGHAIDGLLAKEGVLGGYTRSGEFRYASSSMKTTVMKRAAKQDEELANLMDIDRWLKDNSAVANYVSQYATKNTREWFAECFAEYITSAEPRLVAAEFGKELERLVGKL